MDDKKLKTVLEAIFAASDKPLSINQLYDLFVGDIDQPGKDEIRKAVQDLVRKYADRGFELKQVASGFRSLRGHLGSVERFVSDQGRFGVAEVGCLR